MSRPSIPKAPSGHVLTLRVPGPGQATGTCECGEPFGDLTSTDAVIRVWADHVEPLALLDGLRNAVHQERHYRAESERMIRDLVGAGVKSKVISDAIGTDDQDKPIMSPSTVQRIAREVYGNGEAAPRRRRRTQATDATPGEATDA